MAAEQVSRCAGRLDQSGTSRDREWLVATGNIMIMERMTFGQKTLSFALKFHLKGSFIQAASPLSRSSRHKPLFHPIDRSATGAARNQGRVKTKGGRMERQRREEATTSYK